MNRIISISGSSGVGKTTISRIISLALPNEKTLVLSGDDLHLWERGDRNWKKYTHLNPDANDLNLGREHLKVLRSNNKIYRKKYNHDTGKFDTPSVVYPAKFIVYEGLHALYDSEVRDISWIKIFIETDEELSFGQKAFAKAEKMKSAEDETFEKLQEDAWAKKIKEADRKIAEQTVIVEKPSGFFGWLKGLFL